MFAAYLPVDVHRFFYTCSLCIKDLLVYLLPITVSFFIASAVASFERKAPLFLLSLFLFEAISNGCSVWYAYGWAHLAGNIIETASPKLFFDNFSALWRLPFTKPSWWSADKGMFLGIALGLLSIVFPKLRHFLSTGRKIGEVILTRFFARLIPLFILGFVARMYKTQLFTQMVDQCTSLVLYLTLALLLYILLLFALGSGPTAPPFWQRIRNLIPAAGISFSSGCSLSTMPWTIAGTAKNLDNPKLAAALIPATTNIQQAGDCIINSFLCAILCLQFQGHLPDVETWCLFSALFVLARFATAAVLGGAIFVMLPIYESALHFSPEMIAIILAFNVLLDPIVTCSNVVANGALCRIFEKCSSPLLGKFFPIQPERQT
jgi:Na+/H+-dicarboxylate symporter